MSDFENALNQIRRGALNQYENPNSALNFSEERDIQGISEEDLALIRKERMDMSTDLPVDDRPQAVKDFQRYKAKQRAAEQQRMIEERKARLDDEYKKLNPNYISDEELRKMGIDPLELQEFMNKRFFKTLPTY